MCIKVPSEYCGLWLLSGLCSLFFAFTNAFYCCVCFDLWAIQSEWEQDKYLAISNLDQNIATAAFLVQNAVAR